MVARRPVKRAAASRQAPRKAAPAKPTRDVTAYAVKPPTEYHKAFARWIVTEVGYDPNAATSKRAAFLAGVSIATAARPAFMDSDFIEEWRASAGVTKRGPKPADEDETPKPRKTTKAKAVPDPEEDEDEDFPEDDEFDEDEDSDDELDDDSDEDDESDEDAEFDDEDEAEEEPAPKRRAPAKKVMPARKAARPVKKAAPAKATRRPAKPADDDDEYVF